MIKNAKKSLGSTLSEIPFVKIKEIKSNVRVDNNVVDFMLKVLISGKPTKLIVEVKTQMISKSNYGDKEVNACKSVLLELVHLLGEIKDDMVIIGSWVPLFYFLNLNRHILEALILILPSILKKSLMKPMTQF